MLWQFTVSSTAYNTCKDWFIQIYACIDNSPTKIENEMLSCFIKYE